MTDREARLADSIHRLCPSDGASPSLLPGVYCIRVSHPKPPTEMQWCASMSLIAQGRKEFVLGSDIYRYGAGHYIATPIDLPVTSRIFTATPALPFLGIKIDFDLLTLGDIAAQIDRGELPEIETPSRAVFLGETDDRMLDAALRLCTLLQSPKDAPILGPLVVKELIYYLLTSADGPALRQLARSGSKVHRICQAIHRLRSKLDEEVDVAALARTAGMSRSAFFQCFKDVTAMSPIQYQKRLRLLEARRLMLDDGENAEGSAFRVGYKSASQFSREYSRLFGNSPVRDAIHLKEAGYAIPQI